jgi:hypothetical protein
MTNPYIVDYFSAAAARRDPPKDVLEEGWLHQLFLITHTLAHWPVWQLAAGLALLAALAGCAWLPLGSGPAMMAAGIYLGFAVLDWLLLEWLPQTRRSFGPVGPQLLVMTTPRWLAAIGLGLVGWLLGRADLAGPLLMGVALVQVMGAAVYLWGTLHEPFALGVTRKPMQSVYLNGGPPLRLLHLSDMHVERLTQREANLIELIGQMQPDVIVITGDYLNLSYVDEPAARAEVQKLLAQLSAPLGVYATLGSPPVDPPLTTPSLFDGLNIRLLRDEAAVLTLPNGRTLSLLGLDCTHSLPIDADVFKALVQQAPPDSMRVLLYHSPELMPLVQQYPVDLYLCGHTHGGQVRMPWYGAVLTSSSLGKRYEMGEYVEQNTRLYISRGIGLEGLSAPRLRLLCPPEIVLWELSGC